MVVNTWDNNGTLSETLAKYSNQNTSNPLQEVISSHNRMTIKPPSNSKRNTNEPPTHSQTRRTNTIMHDEQCNNAREDNKNTLNLKVKSVALHSKFKTQSIPSQRHFMYNKTNSQKPARHWWNFPTPLSSSQTKTPNTRSQDKHQSSPGEDKHHSSR